MWCLRTLLFSLVGIATTIFAVVALVRLFSRTARDLNRIQIAEQDSMLLSSIAQLSKQDRKEAMLRLKLPSTLMMLAGVVGLGFAGFVLWLATSPECMDTRRCIHLLLFRFRFPSGRLSLVFVCDCQKDFDFAKRLAG